MATVSSSYAGCMQPQPSAIAYAQPQPVEETPTTAQAQPVDETGTTAPAEAADAGSVDAAGGPTYEQGATNAYPWSGYWWPQRPSADDLNLYDADSALALYDRYVLKTRGYDPGSRAWERANHSRSDSWAGSCQAWAAASLLTREPPGSVTRAGVKFDHDSLEGLITAIYYEPTYQWLAGQRSDTSNQSDPKFADLDPAWLDHLVRTRIGGQHQGFIMDIDAGAEVWNFPVFAYRRSSTTAVDGTEHVSLIVYYANASADTRGEPDWFARTYTYDLNVDSSNTLRGAYTGDSIARHPDFAWAPTGKTSGSGMDPRNPRIDEAIVEEILGYEI